jgi:hypothetical protein
MARLALACLNLGGPKAAWHGDPSAIFSALAKGPTGARSSSFQGLPHVDAEFGGLRPTAGHDFEATAMGTHGLTWSMPKQE